MSVTLVLTEHSGALTAQTLDRYETVRERLEGVVGAPVTVVRYEQLTSLQGAEAVVLSGSYAPWSEHAPEAIERLGEVVRAYDGPVLGICAGMQLQASFAGGTIRHAPGGGTNGISAVDVVEPDGLFQGLSGRIDVHARHSDEIEELPPSFRVLARSAACAVEAIADPGRRWWGTQFHPEEFDAEHPAGERILQNFFELARGS